MKNREEKSESLDLIIENAQVFLSEGLQSVSLGIKDGKIRDLAATISQSGKRRIDARGLTVLPGLIDSQVHMREPGLEHKEDLSTGTKSAVLGGITSVFEMPNTNPPTTTPELLADKLKRAQGRAFSNYAFFLGATQENVIQLERWERLPGCVGIKVFMGSSTGSLLLDKPDDLMRLLKNGRRRAAAHCEDQQRLEERKRQIPEGADASYHPIWRDEETALLATKRLVEYAEQTKRPVHVLHVTSQEEIEYLRLHKSFATVETTPQHLTLFAPDCYERLGSLAQMNPPIRARRHLEALWKGIHDGTVDVLGSDHAPHTLEEKARPYPTSPAGMTGVQTMVPLMLDHFNHGRLSLARLVDLLSLGPARIYGAVGKGHIRIGADADLTIVDLKRFETISNQKIASRCGWTPYDGVKVQGWPVGTIVGGHVAMWEAEVFEPKGQMVTFEQ